MKLVRREHIIPRMLLSQFVGADGMLWIYEKGKPPRKGKPENECVEKNYFEFELRGNKTNNKYENWMSQIEGDAAAVLCAIQQRRHFSRRDAEIWATFVATLFARTRKVKEQVSSAMRRGCLEAINNVENVRGWQHDLLLLQGKLHPAEDIRH